MNEPMLVAFGVLEQTQLGGDPITQPPTHEATLEAELLASGLVRLEQIAEVRNEQVVERLSSLFGLPPATRYAFYNGFDLLKPIWGEVGGVTSPLGALSRGLREHPEENAMDQLLVRLGGATSPPLAPAGTFAVTFSTRVPACIMTSSPRKEPLTAAG